MESKITIQIGEDHKPYIKLVYKASEDLKDEAVAGIVKQLNGTSNTFCTPALIKMEDGTGYILPILPIGDELTYFGNIIEKKLLTKPELKEGLIHLANKILLALDLKVETNPTLAHEYVSTSTATE
ncbi:hypothetical protein [uncultured Clostridium sp.]|uniref:hypothetical protein n=1 Tax=uncultured Clostridium sp. TaxID=59620 RepID=UPI0026310FD0|nr:hypothetical protein [uncultured Clostridium sp.]